jgi:transposase
MIIIRSGLPSELPANCICGYRDGRLQRAATWKSRRSGDVLPGFGRARQEGTCGNGSQWARWFERLLVELKFELWIGDATSLRLAPWASRRQKDLLELLDRLNPTMAELSQAIEQEVEKCPEAGPVMTHSGVGSLTALAFVLIIGQAERFRCGKQIASYLGLVPLEKSSGNRRRLGHITMQGSSMLRFLLVEAAQVTARRIPEWRSKYCHVMMRRGKKSLK